MRGERAGPLAKLRMGVKVVVVGRRRAGVERPVRERAMLRANMVEMEGEVGGRALRGGLREVREL